MLKTVKDIGNFGERAVCYCLEKKGYRIIERNYQIKGGEIDIIAENENFILFIEVKTRRPNSLVGGFESITKRKKGLIIKTAADYCYKNPTKLQPRFDIVEVISDGTKIYSIDYIKNAFDTTGYNIIF